MPRRLPGEVPVHPGPTLQELLKANKSYMRFRGSSERVSLMLCTNIHWRVVNFLGVIEEAPVANRAALTRRTYRFVEDLCAVLTGKRSVRTVPSLKVEADTIHLVLPEDKKVLAKMLEPVLEHLSLDLDEKERE